LGGSFVFDDYDLLEVYSAVRVGGWPQLLGSGRPVLMFSFVVNERLTGFDPFWFHLVNVLLHSLNACLLWLLLRRILERGVPGTWFTSGIQTALTGAVPLLFLASPVQTEAVAYVSSRSETLAATFYLAGLLAFASPLRERNRWLTAALVMLCFAGAAGSKQDKITLPFAILAMDYLLLSRLDWCGLKKSWPTYGLFLAGLVAGFFLLIKPFLFELTAGFTQPWRPYLFTQFRMLFLYLRLLIFPVGLNADYDIEASQTLWENFSWLGLAGLLGLAACAFIVRRRSPLVAFGILFFFITIGPSSSFYPLADYAAERRVYLPSIGFFLAALPGLLWLLREKMAAVRLGLGCLLLLYGAGTFHRSAVWADELALWRDTAEKSPQKVRPLEWLGRVYKERGQPRKAIEVWRRALTLLDEDNPRRAYLLSNLGVAYAGLEEYGKAVKAYSGAIELRGRVAEFWAHRAVALLRLGREEQGWRNFETAFQLNQSSPALYQLRGQEYFLKGRYAEAVEDFETALRLQPENQDVRHNLAAARAMLRQSGGEQRPPRGESGAGDSP